MSRKNSGTIGAPCSVTNLEAPKTSHPGLTKTEKRILDCMKYVRERSKVDPEYAAKVDLKKQLIQCSSTTSARSKKMKKQITLPKFSWDKQTENGD